ncbi:cation acetate symporter [Saccharopolyspora sp. HNM0983]|uniref:Cation acetate symporter n=1 Tax=Saccharopolyspora montiporae TaxID=2781240 RepID=A0A929B8V8_9PSEU|nr:cation acetate symporter [Saccharopolyspora sp. HNM0983]MBE9373975.1 cation acetate symporter [Saccharopolyspora sp. HNM0983]
MPDSLIPEDTAIVNTAVFAVFVLITLIVVYSVSNRGTTSDYFVAGSSFSGAQNGIALSGDFLSAASFLGIAGAIAVHGYDGFLYSIGFLVAWLVNLLLIAERMRNTGRFTMGDVISFRTRQRPVRAAAALSTLVITLVYMIAQMAGAGGLVALLLNVHSGWGQALVIAGVGLIMVFYVLVGGMKGTTWVQIIKATFLLLCVVLITIFLLGKFGYSFSDLLRQAADNNPNGEAIFAPGVQYGISEMSKLDFVSLSLALVLGVGGLPHVLMRFYTVPNAREARNSVVWATWTMVLFYLCTLVIGYGAAALVGTDTILNAPGAENSAAPLLAYEVGGTVILGLVAAVAFATILAVVAGLTLTASASFAHDIYANIIRGGNADSDRVLLVARWTAVGIGLASILGGVLVNGQNIAFLVGLAFAFAASANLPTLLYTLFWTRFNTTGVLFSIYGGLISCLLLVLLSPVVSGSPDSILPDVDFALFPLKNPGIVSIPVSFLLGFIGTFLHKGPSERERQAELEVRSLTGITPRNG